MSMINNLPAYASEYSYIVASVVDNELWFYGAFNEPIKAYQIAKEIEGVVVRNEEG